MPVLGIVASSKLIETGSFDLIQTTVLGTNAGSVSFSSIPSTYSRLQLRIRARTIAAGTSTEDIALRFNGVANSNNFNGIRGDGAIGSVYAKTSAAELEVRNVIPKSGIASSVPGVIVIDILDYQNPNKTTSIRSFGGSSLSGTTGNICFSGGWWASTATVTSITIYDNGGNFASGSRFSLYGIKGE